MYYLVLVRCGTDHGTASSTVRPHLHLRSREPHLAEVTEEYRVLGRTVVRGPDGGGALSVVQVVAVDLAGERDPGEVAQQLIDGSGNTGDDNWVRQAGITLQNYVITS